MHYWVSRVKKQLSGKRSVIQQDRNARAPYKFTKVIFSALPDGLLFTVFSSID